MPAKPAGDSGRPAPVKKGARGKNAGLELDNIPASAGEGIFIHPVTKSKYEGQWQRFDGVMKRHGKGIYTVVEGDVTKYLPVPYGNHGWKFPEARN